MMRRITLSAVLALFGATIIIVTGQEYNEFKRMPDFRGQSFGLENFLMQPFNLASHEEPQQPQNRRQPSYSLEYQVQNDDYEVKKLPPSGSPVRAPIMQFNHQRPSDDFKPVHEIPEPMVLSPPPPRRRQPQGEAYATMFENPTGRRVPPPDTRRPLERPAEFQLNNMNDNDPYPQPLEEVRPERHRKRVMKRRRKKPTTPQPDEEKIPLQEDTIKETLANIFGDVPETPQPTSYQQSSTMADFPPQRRKPSQKRKPIEDNDDKLIGQASQVFSEKIETTTESEGESTQKLKTLLKQQNGQLSLSELLQTQNLSLSDFLKGNPGALSALGAHKVTTEKEPSSQTESMTEKPKTEHHRPHIPKISSKSRPFTKQFNNTAKISRRPTTTTTTTTTEENLTDLPKKLQIIEVTSDRPTYNGFAPKNPRRGSQKHEQKFNYSKEKDEISENEPDIAESVKDEREEFIQSTTKNPGSKQTTLSQIMRETTITEHKQSSKRYGDYRLKLRRKPSTDATTEAASTQTDETTIDQVKITKEPKNRVRVPFMSVNNPEISLILPNKRNNDVTTEKTKERTIPVIKDRINLFKRLNSDEKPLTENTLDTTEPPPTTTSTEAMTTKTETTSTTTTELISGKETSDEIVELLKTGNNAQRLQKILAARNMTVDELLEKRANSSRQPNVTKLFENQLSSNPERKVQKIVELDNNEHPSTAIPTTKKIPPVFPDLLGSWKANKVDSKKVNSFDELFVDESVIRPIKLEFDNREAKAVEKIKEKLNLPPGVQGKAGNPIPLWNVDERTIYNTYPSYDLNKNLAGRPTTTTITESPSSSTITDEAVIYETINSNSETNNRLKSSINEILKEQGEIVKDLKEEKTFIPPAVKSAIIASGVVMGIALIVFVAIFAACGWKQRQFRLRARSSILNDSLNGSAHKAIRRTGTLSPVSFKRSSLYKKSIDFEDSESSISGSSNTSSYLWNTLKHTFQSRNSTLKNRQEKEEKIQERENRSRRNTLSRDDERPRRNTLSRDETQQQRRDSIIMNREVDMPRRNTLTRDDFRRDSMISRDTLARDSSIGLTREDSRRNSCFRDENRRLSSLLRENERCSFKKIDPERNIVQTSVNFKRGGFNGSSRHFDSCDHFN